jgi:DNA-binding protein HU-beta
MNKSEFLAKISRFSETSTAQANKTLETIIGTVRTELVMGNTISVPGLGTFTPHEIGERMGRNLNTGEAVMIPARVRVSFKACKSLKKIVN